ncbi:hypothetical protein A5660_07125 [Mycobacterium alsense]|nr:hypothetical protein A5660_07125 [Mycobacterium alsense]
MPGLRRFRPSAVVSSGSCGLVPLDRRGHATESSPAKILDGCLGNAWLTRGFGCWLSFRIAGGRNRLTRGPDGPRPMRRLPRRSELKIVQ